MLKKHKIEIQRWLEDINEPDIWVKVEFEEGAKWFKSKFENCGWDKDCHYVVDDKYAELRKLQIDKPDTKFEYWNEHEKKWLEAYPLWESYTYRAKPAKYPIFKVGNKGTEDEFVIKFTGLHVGEVVFALPGFPRKVGYVSDEWFEYSRERSWKDVNYNPERELYDKQPIICWDDDGTSARTIGFYDGKNDCAFHATGRRKGPKYTKYLPYPHPDDESIIEMYKNLED